MDAQIKAPFLLTCNDRRLAADAGVGREVRATGTARAPVLVVLHVLQSLLVRLKTMKMGSSFLE